MATSKISFHDLDNVLKNQIIYDAIATRSGTVWNIVMNDAPSANELYTVRFIASNAFVKNDTLTINGASYALSTTNGKELSDSAWAANTVVQLNVEPESKKAFFNGGGVDLSFITAGAEHIKEGYVGVDIEGNPVYGTRSTTYYQQTVEGSRIIIDSKGYYSATLTMPDFMPDIIIIDGYYTLDSLINSYADKSFRAFVIVDFTNQVAWASGQITDQNAHTFKFIGNLVGAGTAVNPASAIMFSHDGLTTSNSCIPYSSCPFASLTPGESFVYNNAMSVNNYSALVSSTIKLTAIKF